MEDAQTSHIAVPQMKVEALQEAWVWGRMLPSYTSFLYHGYSGYWQSTHYAQIPQETLFLHQRELYTCIQNHARMFRRHSKYLQLLQTRLEDRLKWHVWVLKELFDITLKGGLRENSKQRERQDFSKPRNDSLRQKGWMSQISMRFIELQDKEGSPALFGKPCPQVYKKKGQERHDKTSGSSRLCPELPNYFWGKYQVYKIFQGLDKSKPFHSLFSAEHHR